MFSRRYEVLPYSSPLAALEFIRTDSQVDLVISDTDMPEMRGPDLLSEIHRLYPSTPSILMSGNAAALSEVPTGTQFLHKPFSSEELPAKVEAMLVQSRKIQAELSETQRRWSVQSHFLSNLSA